MTQNQSLIIQNVIGTLPSNWEELSSKEQQSYFRNVWNDLPDEVRERITESPNFDWEEFTAMVG